MTGGGARLPKGGSDRVRINGRYALKKMTFFDNYLPPAFDVAAKKVTRHYVDLFAGPGIWADNRGKQYLGSPLKVLEISGEAGPKGYTHATFVNKNRKDHAALLARVDQMVAEGRTNIPRHQIKLVWGDANHVVRSIMGDIHPKSWVFVYADIERPNHWPFKTVRALLDQGHNSVDLYMLFPLWMGLERLIGYTVEHPDAVTRFFGTEEWKSIRDRRLTSSKLQRDRFVRELQELYALQLRELGWSRIHTQRVIGDRGKRKLYQMLFATKHPVASVLADWEVMNASPQRDLLD